MLSFQDLFLPKWFFVYFQELALRSSNMTDPAGELTQIGDPFLGQSTTSDSHARQGSTDSGLGESTCKSNQPFSTFLMLCFFCFLLWDDKYTASVLQITNYILTMWE